MTPTNITLDRFGMAVWNPTFAVAVVGNIERKEFQLIELDEKPLTGDALNEITERNLSLLGVMAFHQGEERPRVVLERERELDAESITTLSREFLSRLERELNARAVARTAKKVGDAVSWIQKLYSLPDTRNGMEN